MVLLHAGWSFKDCWTPENLQQYKSTLANEAISCKIKDKKKQLLTDHYVWQRSDLPCEVSFSQNVTSHRPVTSQTEIEQTLFIDLPLPCTVLHKKAFLSQNVDTTCGVCTVHNDAFLSQRSIVIKHGEKVICY